LRKKNGGQGKDRRDREWNVRVASDKRKQKNTGNPGGCKKFKKRKEAHNMERLTRKIQNSRGSNATEKGGSPRK